MRTLYLLRHAKSSGDDARLPDRERPLSGRGRRAAGQIATHLERNAIRPALVLCSSARRTRETLDAVRAALGHDAEVVVEEELYGADASQLVARLRRCPPEARSIMVIAHNPGLEDVAHHLAGDGDQGALYQLRSKYPTGALATLDLGEHPWPDLAEGQAYLVSLVTPSDLAG